MTQNQLTQMQASLDHAWESRVDWYKEICDEFPGEMHNLGLAAREQRLDRMRDVLGFGSGGDELLCDLVNLALRELALRSQLKEHGETRA